MFILDEDSDKSVNCITVLLNKNEVQQLLGYAKRLLENPSASEHYHLSNEDYQKEITLCMYDREEIDRLHPRMKKLVVEGV